jgi:hypothetical protein
MSLMLYGIVFGLLVLAHLLYDFHWQGAFIAEYKAKYKFILFVHALTWTLCISLVLYIFGLLDCWKFIFLFLTHYYTDGWKCQHPSTPEYFWTLYVDQAIHLVSLIIVMFKF